MKKREQHSAQPATSGALYPPETPFAGPVKLPPLAFSELDRLRVLERVVEESPDGFSVVDRHYFYRSVNRVYQQLHGKPADEIVGHRVAELLGEEVFRDIVQPNLERCFAGEPVRYESWFTFPAGGQKYLEVRYYPLRGDREVEYAVVATHDLTERERAEAALIKLAEERSARAESERSEQLLRKSEQDYRLLFDTMLQGVIYQDARGKIVSLNRAAEQILGRSMQELTGETSASLEQDCIREDGTRFAGREHPSMVALETGREVRDVVMGVYNPREQGYRWIRVSAVPMFREREERPYQVYTLLSDITERKRAHEERERLLAEARRRAAELDAIITAIADEVVIYDESGRIVRMNPSAQRILGYTPEELRLPIEKRLALRRITTADGEPVPAEQLPAVRALRGEVVRGVAVATSPSPATGQPSWRTVSAAPIYALGGRLLGAVSVFSDTTKMHELQNWLRDLVRAVSHDLRTPLQVILGQAQLLSLLFKKAGLKGQEPRSAETIVTSATRMNAMIEDLAESARMESGQLRVEKRPVDLGAFVTDLLQRTRGVMEVGRITLHIPGDLPKISADPDHLERILVNLISNGLKYSEPDTELSISAMKGQTEITISVTDRGSGINHDELPRIFERFYRVNAADKTDGLGLGLYITKWLVENQGGRIRAESEPGKGSTFHFTLPIA